MNRAALRIILDVVLTIALSIAFITAFLWLFTANIIDSAGEAARMLFLFMDVGLVVWVLLVVVVAVRSRGTRPRAWTTLLFAVAGALANLLVVVIVGFIQSGQLQTTFMLFAIEAGIAFLVAAVVVVPIVHAAVKPRPVAQSRS